MRRGLIEVIDGGLGNSIQDQGRVGFRHMGITVSGCLDRYLARCANALVGNAASCACIEIRALSPALKVVQGPVRVALAGDLSLSIARADGRRQAMGPWASLTLASGDVVESTYLAAGTAYLAISGGVDSPLQLGSRSTYQRAMIGGIDGNPIATGNLLPCLALERIGLWEFTARPWRYADTPIRVMSGPQAGHFTPESVACFSSSEFEVTSQIDRMGVRLEGPGLRHVSAAAADIVSDGVTSGAIQVPGNGQPIILLADGQTVGGYPKIATVISADLGRLAQLKPGQRIGFALVDASQAKQALLARESDWNWWAYAICFDRPERAVDIDLTGGWPRVYWE